MAETVNLPRDSTLRELVAVQKASIIASGNAAAIDRLYGSLVRAAKSVEEVNLQLLRKASATFLHRSLQCRNGFAGS